MRFTRNAAAAGALAALAVGGTTAFAQPASAASAKASYGNQCGSGYGVVNSSPIDSLGTVFLTYNASNGNNCVVTIRNTTGTAVDMSAWIHIPDTDEDNEDFGRYTTYAGPVYAYGKGHCVNWGGSIANVYVTIANSNCGAVKENRTTVTR